MAGRRRLRAARTTTVSELMIRSGGAAPSLDKRVNTSNALRRAVSTTYSSCTHRPGASAGPWKCTLQAACSAAHRREPAFGQVLGKLQTRVRTQPHSTTAHRAGALTLEGTTSKRSPMPCSISRRRGDPDARTILSAFSRGRTSNIMVEGGSRQPDGGAVWVSAPRRRSGRRRRPLQAHAIQLCHPVSLRPLNTQETIHNTVRAAVKSERRPVRPPE